MIKFFVNKFKFEDKYMSLSHGWYR